LKNLSNTRWSSHADATNALCNNFQEIRHVLQNISDDRSENANTRNDARSLAKKMDQLETTFMVQLWNHILQRFHATSKSLQQVELDFGSAIQLLQSLYDFLQNIRNRFHSFEQKAIEVSVNKTYRSNDQRLKRCPRRADDSVEPDTILHGSQHFHVNTFYVIIDTLQTELKKRMEAYDSVISRFGFLWNIDGDEHDILSRAAAELVNKYPNDLHISFVDEFQQWSCFMRYQASSSPSHLLKLLKTLHLESTFPNVETALRMYLTLPISNSEGERSFSKLKRIKSELRSTMQQSRLNALSVMSIESDLVQKLSFDNIIKDFAAIKSRRKTF
jgi:hypothetical protein